ncbi:MULTISPECIES: sulfurtransferase TusA family protein [Metallosphaera]|uniref:SirA family protein n=3 Tax=Metallosphaera TaxID=41980 RepID=A4YH01_METS5|nr:MULTISPECIES: sulfurtransferase TusA family protein [Metallosphaera]ABP95703.1 SirA family protein [Metallosphaera sedula DSM 5348]AIM27687.1 SirA family protein [Metallosphaera sedula]AKV74544.1 response regulator SirA [Metallosphaera sedula]AKV76783.1 response regulator SirA [Metallosphaera sedula]AKV79034.1 response regulator SirA [Metallosphaera sedula]
MSQETKIAKTLDVKGMYCPGPVMETAKAIKQINVGEVLEVLATDPAAKPDIEAWARRTGHQILDIQQQGGVTRILVKRAK